MKFSFFHILMSLILALALMSEGNAVTLVPNIATQMKKEEKQAKTIIRLQKVQEKKIAREAIQMKKNTPTQKTPPNYSHSNGNSNHKKKYISKHFKHFKKSRQYYNLQCCK